MPPRALTDDAKDARRDAFLDAALHEFFERGFAATRLDDVAARAGLSKGAIYLYFPSKEGLFLALAERVAAPNIDAIEALAAGAPSAAEAIGGVMRFAPHVLRDTPLPKVLKVLIGEAQAFPEVVRLYRERVVDRALGVVSGLIERGVREGIFDLDEPALAARLLVAPMLLSAIWMAVFENGGPTAIDLDALFALHERAILQGLAPRTETIP